MNLNLQNKTFYTEIEKLNTNSIKIKVLRNKFNTMQDIQDLYNEHYETSREIKENKIYIVQ